MAVSSVPGFISIPIRLPASEDGAYRLHRSGVESVAEKDFTFRTVGPADVKEVLITTSKGACTRIHPERADATAARRQPPPYPRLPRATYHRDIRGPNLRARSKRALLAAPPPECGRGINVKRRTACGQMG